MPASFQVLYLSRSRLRMHRANVIQTLRTVSALHELGVAVRLYLPPHSGAQSLPQMLAERGVMHALDTRASPLLHPRWKKWSRIGYRPFVALNRRALERADAIFTRWHEISHALIRRDIPHSLEIHDWRQLQQSGMTRMAVEAQQRGLIRFFVATAHSVADYLVQAGADIERVCVAPSGTDVDAFMAVPPLDPARLTHPRILYAGRLGATRGLEIFRALAARGVADVTLVGAQERPIESLPGLEVSPPVPYREIPSWYARCEIALMPYQRDLLHADSISPVKLFEAMAAGRPIIVSDLPPIREIVQHGKTALLVDPENVSAWIDAVETLKRDPDLVQRLARAARELAPEFSWRRRAERICNALGWPTGHATTR